MNFIYDVAPFWRIFQTVDQKIPQMPARWLFQCLFLLCGYLNFNRAIRISQISTFSLSKIAKTVTDMSNTVDI